jgi:hypothetical protein
MQDSLFTARQTQRCLQAEERVTARLAQPPLQILDATATDARFLGQGRLGQASNQPVLA